jgi:hypothetical protein
MRRKIPKRRKNARKRRRKSHPSPPSPLKLLPTPVLPLLLLRSAHRLLLLLLFPPLPSPRLLNLALDRSLLLCRTPAMEMKMETVMKDQTRHPVITTPPSPTTTIT